MRRAAALFAMICLICGGLWGCGDDGSGKGFRFPLEAEPKQLDPQVSTDASSVTVIAALFEGLTRLDEEGQAIPGAAEWTVSADGLTYTFTLRESYWSTMTRKGETTGFEDPVMVTADDFVFGMQRTVDPQTGSALAQELSGIEGAADILAGRKGVSALGVRAVNETTLTITLAQPDAAFPARLATTPFMPCNREFFKLTAGRYGLEKQYLLTNGPFLLKAWNHGDSLLLNKNEYYHDAKAVLPVAVRMVIGGDRTVEALRQGTMDAVALSPADVDDAADAGVQVVALQDTVRSLWLNNRDEVLTNVSVRQALRDAVEWDTVYDYLRSVGEIPAAGYIAPAAVTEKGEPYRREGESPAFDTNVPQAQTELAAGLTALYPDKKSPALPSLTVLAAEDETSANLARYLIQSWQKNLHLKCTLTLVPEEQLLSRLKSGKYQAAIVTVTADGLSGSENLRAYRSTAAGNYSSYQSAGFDRALDEALRGGRTALETAEQVLRQECPTLPLSFTTRYYGIAAGDSGITVRPFNGGSYGSTFSFLKATKKG